jgi:hypothetical protein
MPSSSTTCTLANAVIPRLSLQESRFTRHSPELGIVPKPVGVSTAGLTPEAMMAEQGAESRHGHGLSAVAAFQGDEQSG